MLAIHHKQSRFWDRLLIRTTWRPDLVSGYDGRMRYRLRTLMLLMAMGPPVLAAVVLWPDTFVKIFRILSLPAVLVVIWVSYFAVATLVFDRSHRRR